MNWSRSQTLPALGLGSVALGAMLLALTALPASAQPFSLHAEVTNDVVEAGGSLTYLVHVEGPSFNHVEPPEPPEAAGLDLHDATPSTRHDVSFSDGEIHRSITHAWTYEPKSAGTAHIQPAEVTVDNRIYATDAVDVTVVDASSQPVFRDPDSNDSNPSSSQAELERPDDHPEISPSINREDLFIEAELDTDRVYRQEQAVVEYYMYYREDVEIQRNRLAGGRDAAGFWQEDLDVEQRPVPTSVTIDGRPYQRFLLRRSALFPTQTGTLEIPALEVQSEVRRHAFGSDVDARDPEAYDYETEIVTANPKTLTAAPLPDPAPSHFHGAVGQYDLDARLDTNAVEIGEEVELRVSVEGRGNLPTIRMPSVSVPESFEVFGPEEDVSIDRSASEISGTKTATYTLVAQGTGTHIFSPITFSFFDPGRASYETLQVDLPAVHVTGEEPAAPTDAPMGGLPTDDIAGVMTDAEWTSGESTPLYRQPWPYAAVALPLLFAAGLLAFRRWNEEPVSEDLPSDPASYLREARAALDPAAVDPFYDRIEQAAIRCIEQQTGEATGGWTRDRLDDLLSAHEVSPATRQQVIDLLDACDQARFAPASVDASNMERDWHTAQRTIDQLSEELSSSE